MQTNVRQRSTKQNPSFRLFLPVMLIAAASILLYACGFKYGDVDAVKQAENLAIACKTDEALAALDRATQGGGLAGGMADLMRVAFLRDAGRMAEADAAMKQRNERWKADAENAAEAEKAVDESVEELRAERQKQAGHRTCD